MRLYDISMEVTPDMVVWPTEAKPVLKQTMRIKDGDAANVSQITMGMHTGTHIDAPYHSIADGSPVSEIPLERFIGIAAVIELPDVDLITADVLEASDIARGVRKLLLKTMNSTLWVQNQEQFNANHIALAPDAASWVVSRDIQLIGIDYLSIQQFRDPTAATHTLLLDARIIILEGLMLSDVAPGTYQLVCFPLKTVCKDGAPVRAVLIQD